jgi:hypothetical protein
MELIEDLVTCCGEYASKKITLEAALLVEKYTKEANGYIEYIKKLDKQLKESNMDLRDTVKAVNRICRQYDLPPIFDGNEGSDSDLLKFTNMVIEEMSMEKIT